MTSLAPHREDGVDWRDWIGQDYFDEDWTGEGLAE